MTFPSSLRRAVCMGAFLLALSDLPAHATTFTVTNLNDSGDGSLRQVIAQANATSGADAISFASTLKGRITLTSGELPITSNLNINGPGATVLAISGNNSSRIFNIADEQVVINGLTLTEGKQIGADGLNNTDSSKGGPGGNVRGGAIYNTGTLSLTNVVLQNNSAVGGNGGRGRIGHGSSEGPGGPGSVSSTPGGDGGTSQGGAVFNSGILTLVGTRLQNNSAIGGHGGNGGRSTVLGGSGGSAQGGAIYNAGQLSQRATTFQGNHAVAGAGGQKDGANGTAQEDNIYVYDVTPIARDITFDMVQGGAFQGQLVADGRGQSLTYSLVSGQLPQGLSLASKTGLISGRPKTPVSGLKATYRVTNRFRSSNIATITFNVVSSIPRSIVVTTPSDNSTSTDGKTSLREAIDLANENTGPGSSAITFNLSANTPPLIALKQGILILKSNTSIEWNGSVPLTIQGGSGSFEIDKGTATLSGLIIMGATSAPAVTIEPVATLNISNCTLSGNKATAHDASLPDGGALYNRGTLNVASCTIKNNYTPTDGGGIYNFGGAVTIVNSTICNNTADFDGGAIYNQGTLAVDSCTITGNKASSVFSPSSGGIYNEKSSTIKNSILVSNSPGNTNVVATNSLVGGTYTAAGLDPRGVQDNGGPTQTVALLPGSPAINAGQTSLSTDQRGITRPQGSAPDIGAFEFQNLPALSVNSPSVKEGNSGQTALTFTLTLSQASTSQVSVIVNTRQDTAKAGSDYVSVPRATVTFAPGTIKQTFTVQVVGDTLVESDEQFQLILRSPVNATLGASTGTATILNDDSPPKSPAFTASGANS